MRAAQRRAQRETEHSQQTARQRFRSRAWICCVLEKNTARRGSSNSAAISLPRCDCESQTNQRSRRTAARDRSGHTALRTQKGQWRKAQAKGRRRTAPQLLARAQRGSKKPKQRRGMAYVVVLLDRDDEDVAQRLPSQTKSESRKQRRKWSHAGTTKQGNGKANESNRVFTTQHNSQNRNKTWTRQLPGHAETKGRSTDLHVLCEARLGVDQLHADLLQHRHRRARGHRRRSGSRGGSSASASSGSGSSDCGTGSGSRSSGSGGDFRCEAQTTMRGSESD